MVLFRRFTRRDVIVLGAGAALVALPGCSLFTQATMSNTPGVAQWPNRQLRAVWIATVVNVDWPSRPGLAVAAQKQEFLHLLDALQSMHMNALVAQIKPTADAFYPSQYGPWSEYLTGVQGRDPGYDPLAFMLEETHKRNIEFHAWFNPYRVSMQSNPDKLSASHPAHQHPDWLISYGGRLYYNPGLPEAREFIIASILEVVQRYDIDAVHMDDYFYPYPVAGKDFPDEAAWQRYGVGKFANKGDWRRDNVNRLIQELASAIKRVKPYVKLGISPFGVWRNKATDPSGSDTKAGAQNYDDLYADTRTWIRNGWLDYIAPQIYWNIGLAAAAYDKLVDWWSKEVAKQRVHLYIGQGAYKIHADNAAWDNPGEMPNQLKLNLQYSAIKGSIFFSMKSLLNNPLGIKDRLSDDIYKQPVLIPEMPWLGGSAPQSVTLNQAQATTQGVELRWEDRPQNTTAYYAIYRLEGEQGQHTPHAANAPYLLATVRKRSEQVQQSLIDTTAQAGKTYTYYVTALDRLHHESTASNERSVKR
ncbi:MAG: family 10 glycosylhydrolase [Ktedonobacteraceae bacterium]|nr:family 10 glycosylhydrolase [Ktedonobacteraceae bacterium]